MIDDIAINDEFFDNDFFAYREDADVAWRAQLMDWKCLYVPYAKVGITSASCAALETAMSWTAKINMHSVKNRFLLRMKNITGDLYWRNFFSITARDIGGGELLPAVGTHFPAGVPHSFSATGAA